MGRSRYRVGDPKAPHFVTCTILNWIALFTRPQTVDIILQALQYRQENSNWKVYGYVILENHLHLLVQCENLAEEFPRFKSYTARQLIDYLKAENAQPILKQLSLFRKRHKIDRDYQLWEEGYHPQMIENEAVLRQKLDYIHNNPVKRGYVERPEHWRYSSAGVYAGKPGLISVFSDW